MNPTVRFSHGLTVKRLLAHGLRRVLRTDDGGNALVEMAFAAPFMMLMVMGMTSFGLMLDNFLVLSHAVDVGARAFSVSRGISTAPCADAVTDVENAAPGLTPSGMTFTFTISNPTTNAVLATYTGSTITGSGSGGCSASPNNYIAAGNAIAVNVVYPSVLTMWGWAPSTMNLQVQTAEIIQ